MPTCGKAAASTALPQPPRTSQKVPKNSAASLRDTDEPSDRGGPSGAPVIVYCRPSYTLSPGCRGIVSAARAATAACGTVHAASRLVCAAECLGNLTSAPTPPEFAAWGWRAAQAGPRGMSRRVVVIGAGVGGLAAALDLAARGREVLVLERAAAPGGKMRQIAIGDARIDGGPTVFTMRWVFEELFAAAGARLADHLTLQPVSVLARHAWDGDAARLDLFADIRASADAIGAFAGAAEARGYLDFVARAEADLCGAGRPLHPRRAADAGLPRQPGRDRRGRPAAADLALQLALVGAGRAFQGPAAAPVVRPLRHLCRLLPLPGAGDADADRPCRAIRRLAGGGRHAPHRPRHRGPGGGEGRAIPLRGGGRGDPDRGWPRPRRAAGGWRGDRGRRGGRQCRCLGDRHRAVRPGRGQGGGCGALVAPVAERRHLGHACARPRASRWCGTTCSSRATIPASSPIFRCAPGCRRRPPSMSAPRIAATTTRRRAGRSGCCA